MTEENVELQKGVPFFHNDLTRVDCVKIILKYNKEKRDRIFNQLTDNEKEIFSLYFSADDERTNYIQISKKLGIRLEKVSYIIFTLTKKIIQLFPEDFISMRNNFYKEFPGFTKEEVEFALLKIDEKLRNILISFYGLDGKRIPWIEICDKFNINKGNSLKIYLDKGQKELMKILNVKMTIAHSQEKFYKMFKGFKKFEIDEVLLQIDEENKQLLSLYYGLNNEILAPKDIIKIYGLKFNVFFSKIKKQTEKVNKLLSKLNISNPNIKSLYEYFSTFYEEEIDWALTKIDYKNRELLELFCGLNGTKMTLDELIKKYGFEDKDECLFNIRESLRLIREVLITTKDTKIAIYKDKFYDNFKMYSKDQVDEALEILDDDLKNILILYYGLKGQKIPTKDIGAKYNFDPNAISGFLIKGINIINNILLISKEVNSADEKIFHYFSNYPKEKVKQVILKSEKRDREILSLYLNRKETGIKLTQISNKYGIDYKNIENYVNDLILQIKNNLENRDTIEKDFYKNFAGFTKEEVDTAVSKLDDKSKDILTLNYGLNGSLVHEKKVIRKKYKMSTSMVNSTINKSIVKIKEKLEDLNSKKMDIQVLYDKFYSYSRTEIDEVFSCVNKKYRDILMSYYGLDGEKLSIVNISRKYSLSTNTVGLYIRSTIKLLETKLLYNSLKNEDESQLYASMQNLFLSHIKIKNINDLKYAVSSLNKNEFKLLCCFYGLDNKNIKKANQLADIFLVDEEQVFIRIERIISKINSYDMMKINLK